MEKKVKKQVKDENGNIIILNVKFYIDNNGVLAVKQEINTGISPKYSKKIDEKVKEIVDIIGKNTEEEKEKLHKEFFDDFDIEDFLNDFKKYLEDKLKK